MMKPMNLQDSKEREAALDPSQSFIVQAPAGSGKTELLTQRFLVLLGIVKEPEEILAITFTKKSAAEMRTRVISALKNAENTPEPKNSHEKKTWTLAKNALKNNVHFNWKLLDNPNRLQIQTIDSFNASLTRHLPLLANFGAPLEIADDPSVLYREAVHEFLSHLEENVAWAEKIEQLLMHMDNDLSNVEKLLIDMLAKRDQWLPYITQNANNPELRKTLEQHLSHVITDTLQTLHDSFPEEYADEFVALARFAAQNVIRENPESSIRNLAELTAMPGSQLEDLPLWDALANLLLTKEDKFRKDVTKKEGFPAPSELKNPDEKKLLSRFKQRMKELLENLRDNEELNQALIDFRKLPESNYAEHHWETLAALHDVLRVVVAQLKLVFQAHGQIDFIENAQAAFHALGSDDAPTDLTLALDYKIQHILIDEFQDTSNSQFRLLEKLIAGWEPNDGRTLFLVGDPMQSIYRFREAEVGLFIRARKKGIGALKLKSLNLSVNFRSKAGVVNWVNEHFSEVFPAFEDIASGAVSFSASSPHNSDSANSECVKLHSFVNSDAETQSRGIVDIILENRKIHPDKNIAILVRSRTHLQAILPALKAANLSYRALDIEPLLKRPVIQDLMALTRALLFPADRISWLSILRAPFCGLTLGDLLIIAGNKSKQILWGELQSREIFTKLSVESQTRLNRILPILKLALEERRRHTLRDWVEQTWLSLGGPASVSQFSDLEDAETYFELLESMDHAYDLPHSTSLDHAITELYAAPLSDADNTLQIMTIHNAKGLEFDIVILPFLERRASQDDNQLLRWMERARTGEQPDLIMAPIQAVGEENNSIYDYIKRQHYVKNDYEMSRLLYVAATRAKEQLHIFFNLKTKEHETNAIKKPINNSLLNKLWPAIENQYQKNTAELKNAILSSEKAISNKSIKRLTSNWKNPFVKPIFTEGAALHQNKSGFQLVQNNAKYVGTVLHQILQLISEKGLAWWNSESALHSQYLKTQLQREGMLAEEIPNASTKILQALQNIFADPRGQWILQPHQEASSEFSLTMGNKNYVLDRTFVDETGTRWIIDYKSADYAGDDLENFLLTQQKQYENQLYEYYLAVKELDSRPIKVGLYFPLIPAWREWEF